MPDPIRVVACAVVQDGRLLLVRKRGTARFMLPGGKIEAQESDETGLAREIQEELGCALAARPLRYLGRFAAPAANEPGRTVEARVYLGALLGAPRPAAEIEEAIWRGADELAAIALAPLLAERVIPALRAQRLL